MPDTLVAPAYQWVPEHTGTAGGEVCDFAEVCGLNLDGEQRLAVDVLMAERGDQWAALEGVLVAARQNLKTHVFKAIVFAHLYLFDAPLVVWTAHEFSTAMEAFRDCKQVIAEHDFLSRRVLKISEANGEEGIEFTSGQRLRFKARTRTGGRGLTGDVVILDEAFALQPSHMGSLMPTLSAKSMRGAPQIQYGSSAGMVTSGILRALRDRGRKGGDPSLAYLEWCAPPRPCAEEECDHAFGRDGCVLDDVEMWRQANPALDRRIAEWFIAAERRSLPPAEFARERLGWWEDPQEATGFNLEDWLACAAPEMTLADPLVLALDVSPNSASGAIVACGGPVEIIDHRRGTSWLVGRLVELVAAHKPSSVGIDPDGPAGALLDDLARAGLFVRDDKDHPDGILVALTAQESRQACAYLVDKIVDQVFQHHAQQALDLAVVGARRRQSGDAWKWSRRDSEVDISPLVAATIAHFMWHTMPKVHVEPDPFFFVS